MLRIAFLALLIPAQAFAAVTLPLSARYGNCSEPYVGPMPILDATGYGDEQMSCTPLKVRGTNVTFECIAEDASGEANYKPPHVKTTIVEDAAAGTVTITGINDTPLTLHRCK